MKIDFDPKKAASNLQKHGVSFEEAATCLLDPLALVRDDPDARGEARLVLLGMSHAGRLLTVCYTLRDEEVARLISARPATKKEEKSYA
ncbi:MAG: BrnT family toxin [Nitrosomonadales bacterium]|nr:BrnT family toxin [Nitrosomonadales bacterium]